MAEKIWSLSKISPASRNDSKKNIRYTVCNYSFLRKTSEVLPIREVLICVSEIKVNQTTKYTERTSNP